MSNLLKDNKELMSEYDFDKNKDIDLDTLTLGSSKKVWWICFNGHSWATSINVRAKGHSCPYCAGFKAIPGVNDAFTLHPDLLNELDYEKNYNIDIHSFKEHSEKKLWWICPKGHSYESAICERVRGRGCSICAGKRVVKGLNDLGTTRPELLEEWDYEKNTLSPYEVMENSNKKVWWICKKNHSWKSLISVRSRGCGCPICSSTMKTSFPEKVVYFYIKKYFSDSLENYKPENFSNNRELDIYIPSLNTAIEYDGELWHRSVKKDLLKNKLCIENNIKLIRIREPKCPVLNDTCKCVYLESIKEFDLQKTILSILNDLKVIDPDINIVRDRTKILNMIEYMEYDDSLATKNPEIAKQWHPTKNGKMNPKTVKVTSNKKAWWLCDKRHEWEAVIYSRTMNGNGCPYCSNQKILKGYNDIATLYPEIFKEWNYEKNIKLGYYPEKFSTGSKKKVWWICNLGHEWEATIGSRTRNNCGCPYCCNQKILSGYNDLLTVCPKAKNFWDYERNNILPNTIAAGTDKKFYWIINGKSVFRPVYKMVKLINNLQ